MPPRKRKDECEDSYGSAPPKKRTKAASKTVKVKDEAPKKPIVKTNGQGKTSQPKSQVKTSELRRSASSRKNQVIDIADTEGEAEDGHQTAQVKGDHHSAGPPVVTKRLCLPGTTFPRFNEEASVFINLGTSSKRHLYRLHSEILQQSSTWFRNSLSKKIIELDEGVANKMVTVNMIRHIYELEFDEGRKFWQLVKSPLTEIRSLPARRGTTSSFSQQDQALSKAVAAVNASPPNLDGNLGGRQDHVDTFYSKDKKLIRDADTIDSDTSMTYQRLTEYQIPSSIEKNTKATETTQGINKNFKDEAGNRPQTVDTAPEAEVVHLVSGADTTIKDGFVNGEFSASEQNPALSTFHSIELAGEAQDAESNIVPIGATQYSDNLGPGNRGDLQQPDNTLPSSVMLGTEMPNYNSAHDKLANTRHSVVRLECSKRATEPRFSPIMSGKEHWSSHEQLLGPAADRREPTFAGSGPQFSTALSNTEFMNPEYEVLKGDLVKVEGSVTDSLLNEAPAEILSMTDVTHLIDTDDVDVEIIREKTSNAVPIRAKEPSGREEEVLKERLAPPPAATFGKQGLKLENSGNKTPQDEYVKMEPILIDGEEIKVPILEAAIPKQLVVDAPRDVIEAYDNLFRVFYNMPLTIDKIMFGKALHQIENLLDLADVYGLPEETGVRVHIAKELIGFDSIWRAIFKEPARWLKIAVALRSKAIFNEAIIHIVGSHPKPHPFSLKDVKTAQIVHELIRAKIDELDVKRASADLALLELSNVHDIDTITCNSFTYEVYRTWQDHNRHTMIQTLYSRRSSRNADLIRYRQLAAGGDAYLRIEKVIADYKENMADIGVELDADGEEAVTSGLLGMKRAAENICSPLVANNLRLAEPDMLDVTYLTCTTISDDELPWNARQT